MIYLACRVGFLAEKPAVVVQVNLRTGIPTDTVNETCTAGAGTLTLEFGLLSRLLGDPVFEGMARRTVNRLWSLRSNVTGLFGKSFRTRACQVL